MFPIFLFLCPVSIGAPWLKNALGQPEEDWWYDMGDTWQISNHLASFNPFYKMYKQSAAQMDWYGYAQHVGKINRGQFTNPEQNVPSHRAMGHQADFNPEDLESGVFNYNKPPQGQRFRASAVHVSLGLANHIGEVRTMPLGQHVQADGTVLVQTSPGQSGPCQPDPCKHLALHTCTPVNQYTARCSDIGEVQLILTGYDLSDNDYPNVNVLYLEPDYHDGTACMADDCGFDIDDIDYEDAYDYYGSGSGPSKFTITLTKMPSGSNYRDYTYAVFARVIPDNASTSRTKLRVSVDGNDRQVLAVPQWDGTTNVNYDGRVLYFYGCFRPQSGLVDTRGAGFFDYEDSVIAGLGPGDDGLCYALLNWTDEPGFNPYDGSGSGTPQVPGSGGPA